MQNKALWIMILSPIIILILLGLYLIGIYNGLVGLNQKVEAQWAQVENQYQRRFDLIPNLVGSVKGAMKQEKEVFGAIAQARTRYAGANTTEQKVAAASQLEGALSRLLVVIENYPELRSTETVQQLMDELAGTENRVATERRRFNEMVKDFNTKIKTFPTLFLANMFGFQEKAYFESESAAKEAPKVEF